MIENDVKKGWSDNVSDNGSDKGSDKGSNKGLNKVLAFLAFGVPNILGLFLYLPLLFATLMSFDAPGSGKHWAHWFFVAANILLGPLCLIGLIFKTRRHSGLIAFALLLLGWAVVDLVCGGRFTC